MQTPPLTEDILHNTILNFIIEHGLAPDIHDLAALLKTSDEVIVEALHTLAKHHGVVLLPEQTAIWAIGPFSMLPTKFPVRTPDKTWWGHCTWCAIGVASLLNQDVTVTASLGTEGKAKLIDIHIHDGCVEDHYVGHCPLVPAVHKLGGRLYMCRALLLAANEPDVDVWCEQHHIPKGDVHPLQTIFDFAKEWYGLYLAGAKIGESIHVFKKHGLRYDVWEETDSEGGV